MPRRTFSKVSDLSAHVRAQTRENAKLITDQMGKSLKKSVDENVYKHPEGYYRRSESLKNIKTETNIRDSNRTYSRVFIAPKNYNTTTSLFGQESINIQKGDKVYTAWWIDGTTGKKGNGGFERVARNGVRDLKHDNVRNFTDQAINDVEKYIKNNIGKMRSKNILY